MFQQNIRAANQALVREINLYVIMRSLRKHAPVSRAGLAEITSLNKSTVSSLIKELLTYEMVRETGLSTVSVGRPSRLLEVNPAAGTIISSEITCGAVSVILTDFSAQVLWQGRETVDDMKQSEIVFSQLLGLLRRANIAGRDLGLENDRLLGITLSVPGVVYDQRGDLLFAPNLGWSDVPLGDMLADHFLHTPVFVENEANTAALGEYFFGAAQGHKQILYLSAGVGLGGALLLNGQLFRGSRGYAGEFGHMTIDVDGVLCNCGNRGCWETVASEAALLRFVREQLDAGVMSSLHDLTYGNPDNLSVSLLKQAADAGDAVARTAFAEVGRNLGIGISSLVNALNIDLVMLGGSLSVAGDYILAAINVEVQKRTMRWNVAGAQVVLAQHGLQASLMGGVARVYQAVLANPSHIMGLAV